MAGGASGAPAMNGTNSDNKIVELAIDLPRSPGMRVNIHLTVLAASIVLFLTTTSAELGSAPSAMGSFVYAMPDRYNPAQPMSTTLYSAPASLDFTVRMAKVLVRKLNRPCYVGNSVNLSGAAGGGSVEEEMEAFRYTVDTVVNQVSAQHSWQYSCNQVIGNGRTV
ncbi:uncharacterized protein MYCFIDRAFT_82199 [Pseudocercospora fijiensis CIRAD86]|uniref:Uncharacterized protein n=1 Tax=Pseudocercospora fijiensis (strain CIRAD86) TaxID=383855 RepID=M3BAE7_PSEFD|nr:uncharacterized protein MYCFIDRAFT_82199 [Pseudocercospora fijiensis CIRAD86]EME86277.1 hypothetical protein MYCFIDRAFT_82199 [Pseudocercospora fijiensis CIRAD86]